MPDGPCQPDLKSTARIGPNAILQLAGPVERLLGAGVMAQLLDLCRVPMPSGKGMIPEDEVGRVHRAMWQLFPAQARELSEQAGAATARYIRTHRMPATARLALRLLPRALGERALTRAIAAHAWTFCGSGTLGTARQGREIHFMLRDNPLADIDLHNPHPCHWHAAVFEELFSAVLGRPYFCEEVSCCGCGGDLCRFVVRRQKKRAHFKGLEV
ncbi:bacteriochlorophyll 4-vinyl reductase [Roseobacter weihaiensis]|uniref:bacteriochlorophyll 4-vinyl reductase n=1 Tax=Roseobacter weihaiensis TaxID=2763262 RepID=UPI001D0A9410|nr:bacteriochlorophyll 4-vinyl reductase [Roseobacter sp. H9]